MKENIFMIKLDFSREILKARNQGKNWGKILDSSKPEVITRKKNQILFMSIDTTASAKYISKSNPTIY